MSFSQQYTNIRINCVIFSNCFAYMRRMFNSNCIFLRESPEAATGSDLR